jgi:hypothetical protein
MKSIGALAEEWTRGIPGKYAQIQAICAQLRDNYKLDRTAHAPEDCEFPVGHFLFETKRGADYQFATAATLLLRSLGFSTRVVSGFYASPEHYDPRKRHTAVHSADVHFWCEVYLGGGTWATVDPSPGYAVLGPPPGLWERVITSLNATGRWLLAKWIWVLSIITMAALIVVGRHFLLDQWMTFRWKWVPAKTVRGRVLQTARLMDRRLKYSGRSRPGNITLSRWLRQQSDLKPMLPSMTEFMQLSDWAAFGDSSSDDAHDPAETEACCQSIRRNLTLSGFWNQQLVVSATNSPISASPGSRGTLSKTPTT